MEFTSLPCIYFPTKVVMIDDNLSFLENMRLTIDDYQNVQIYSNPLLGIKNLSEYRSILTATDFISNLDLDEIDEDNALSINYKKLNEIVNNNEEISVLVVDYSMPEMNGIEFFNKMKSFPAKKIMLTGEADNQIAVNAFNQGLIDRFIVKGGAKVSETLRQYINELKVQYFIDSKVNQLVAINNHIKESPDYIQLVKGWIKDNHICRFYQYDQNGSLVGIDKSSVTRCFYLLDTESFNTYFEIAEYQGADQNILNQLSQRSAMPVFMTDESIKNPAHDWLKFMRKVNGAFKFNSEIYYFCFIEL